MLVLALNRPTPVQPSKSMKTPQAYWYPELRQATARTLPTQPKAFCFMIPKAAAYVSAMAWYGKKLLQAALDGK
jgi:hypothetical protein